MNGRKQARISTTVLLIVLLVGAATAALADGGSGVPPPDPVPPDPPQVLNAQAQNEVVLRGVELDDLLTRASGRTTPCEAPCVKPRDPQAIAENISNSCHVVRSLGFQANYAAGARLEVVNLAARIEAACLDFLAVSRGLGPLNGTDEWHQAAARMEAGLPGLIDAASFALLEVLK